MRCDVIIHVESRHLQLVVDSIRLCFEIIISSLKATRTHDGDVSSDGQDGGGGGGGGVSSNRARAGWEG